MTTTKSTPSERRSTARPRTDIDEMPAYDADDGATMRTGRPSTFVRNDAGEIEIQTDEQITDDLEAELDAQHEAELADKAKKK